MHIIFNLSLVAGLFMLGFETPELLHMLSPHAKSFKVPLMLSLWCGIGLSLVGVFIAYA